MRRSSHTSLFTKLTTPRGSIRSRTIMNQASYEKPGEGLIINDLIISGKLANNTSQKKGQRREQQRSCTMRPMMCDDGADVESMGGGGAKVPRIELNY